MNQIRIELNKREFAAGETVSGEVHVELEQETHVRGVRLVLQGYEKASWREGSGKHRHTHSETRQIFDEELTFFGAAKLSVGELVGDSIRGLFSKCDYPVLHGGAHRYPFSYTLPPDLPGDYQSAFTSSCIYYGLKAKVDLPLRSDLESVQELVISEPPPREAPREVSQSRTKHFLLNADSLVEAAVHLDTDTFEAGAVIRCRLEVTNRAAGKEIDSATLVLRQVESLQAQGRSNRREGEIRRVKLEKCRFPYKDRRTEVLECEIPADLYPSITRGTLVKLDYEVQVILHIPWAIDTKIEVPIRIVKPGGIGGVRTQNAQSDSSARVEGTGSSG